MQRLDVRFRPEARIELRNIVRFIIENGGTAAQARRFAARIEERCRKIADAPLGGRPRDDLGTGLRTVPFEGRAVILYEATPDRVRILNIFYGGRDYEAFYREGGPEGG